MTEQWECEAALRRRAFAGWDDAALETLQALTELPGEVLQAVATERAVRAAEYLGFMYRDDVADLWDVGASFADGDDAGDP